jgi:hypothetical protein
LTKIASQGALSYFELQVLDINEFFLLVVNYENQANKQKQKQK